LSNGVGVHGSMLRACQNSANTSAKAVNTVTLIDNTVAAENSF
jgi:hypothetical protein